MSTTTSKQIMMVPGLDTKTVKALPVFLVKLLSMLEDDTLDEIICWDEVGNLCKADIFQNIVKISEII